MRRVVTSGGMAILVGTSVFLAPMAHAQAPAPPPKPAAVAPTPAPAAAPPPSAASMPDAGAPEPVPTDLLQVHPGGITASQAGARSAATSWNAKASMENLRGAAARVDQAWATYLPRLSGVGKYTRLSNFTLPPITFGGASFSIPFFVLDNWLLQATVTVPVSDYFLRIDQTYTAATQSEEAARWDVVTARSAALSNGEIAYYAWLRARAAIVVAVQTLNDQKTHFRDAGNQFAVGNASKADVLRAETSVWAADLAVERAKNLSDLTEKQLRVAIHAPDEESLLPGEDLETGLPPTQGNLKQLTIEALSARPEVKSADASAAASRKRAEAAKAARYPVLSAFADGIEGNPNPRVIPPSNVWTLTWDVGAQVTWSPNDILLANGQTADLDSQAAATEANKNSTRDGIEVEVIQQFQAVQEADFAIQSTARQLTSAEEAYRVATELFNNGRGTATTVSDAQTDLTRARLDVLNAKTDARIARIRLEHAIGRDVSRANASASPSGAGAPSSHPAEATGPRY
jgi:outer membrane protein TolC